MNRFLRNIAFGLVATVVAWITQEEQRNRSSSESSLVFLERRKTGKFQNLSWHCASTSLNYWEELDFCSLKEWLFGKND